MPVVFGVLGPVTAADEAGHPIALKGPRHRAVLARLIVARGRTVPVGHLVDDLWVAPPAGAVSAVRTFVAALRRALEPDRPPRSPARLLVTEGTGYALRAAPEAVDAWRFERVVHGDATAVELDEAIGWWRGPAYADFAGEPWAHAERSRLTELRLHAIERRAAAWLAAGRAAETVAELDAHVSEHPWREEGWRLLALALYRAGRQGDALAVLRRARTLLAGQLGLDPGPALRQLETDILRQSDGLLGDAAAGVSDKSGVSDNAAAGVWEEAAAGVWEEAAADYDRIVAAGARSRLDSTVGLLRDLAVAGGGGLEASRRHRLAAITAAQELGDPELTARVIGAYDVPAIWTRPDDPAQAAAIVAAAERTLRALPPGREAARARLLATIAVESRGTGDRQARDSAAEAERIARRLDDPALLAFALNGRFMQSCHRTGLAPERDAIGAELVPLAARHGLVTAEVLGHLIRLQARSALADFTAADRHAAAADRLAARHELPLVAVFTEWYRALKLAATGPAAAAEAAYRAAARRLAGAGMPGVAGGLLPLAVLCLRVRHGGSAPGDADWGPYEPWARPHVLLAAGRRKEAASLVRRLPDPPPDLLAEALWCLLGRAALAVGDHAAVARARRALLPAAAELAGAGSGLLTAGPVAEHLAAFTAPPT